jgi:hypothetical protein
MAFGVRERSAEGLQGCMIVAYICTSIWVIGGIVASSRWTHHLLSWMGDLSDLI